MERSFRSFIQDNPHALAISENPESGEAVVHVNFGKFMPFTFALIVGDAVHNLRTALDHANWELRGLDGGAQNRHTTLPVRDNRIDYEAACNGIKTPIGDLPDFFKALEMFKGGSGDLIYALHELNIIDKHMFLPTAGRSVVIPSSDLNVTTLSIGVQIRQSGTISATPIEADENTKLTLDICFGDIEVFQFKPIVPTLVHLADAVEQVIERFEALVACRNGRFVS
ncbi:MAG: hypothetical protein PSX80_12675 [bacterium]|nr:hypothetical protein [bacterium]